VAQSIIQGAKIYVNDKDMTGDASALSVINSQNMEENTTLLNKYKRFLPGIKGTTFQYEGFWNSAQDQYLSLQKRTFLIDSSTYATNSGIFDIVFGNGIFVAISSFNIVLTSIDGLVWDQQSCPTTSQWAGLAFGAGVFVAVGYSGTTQQAMRSTDGITWTAVTTPVTRSWGAVAYGGSGYFIAIAYSGIGNRVMLSTNGGVTWIAQTTPADIPWRDVIFANDIWVAVADSGASPRVMTSVDGVTWVQASSISAVGWNAIAYGDGKFVVVSNTGGTNRMMTSPDGLIWTDNSNVPQVPLNAIAYGDGVFVALAISGASNRMITSLDGITWTVQTSTADNYWTGVAFANSTFVCVASSYAGDKVMRLTLVYNDTLTATIVVDTLANGSPSHTGKVIHSEYSQTGKIGEIYRFSIGGEFDGGSVRSTIMLSGIITGTAVSSIYDIGIIPDGKKLYLTIHVLSLTGVAYLFFSAASDDTIAFTSSITRINTGNISSIGAYVFEVNGPLNDDFWNLVCSFAPGTPSAEIIASIGIK